MAQLPPSAHHRRLDAVLLATRATVIVLLLIGLGVGAGVFLGGVLVHVFEMLHLNHLATSS